MAVEISVASGHGDIDTTSRGNYSMSLTAPTGTGRTIVLSIFNHEYINFSSLDISYGGVSLTKIAEVQNISASDRDYSMWIAYDIPSGSNLLEITFSYGTSDSIIYNVAFMNDVQEGSHTAYAEFNGIYGDGSYTRTPVDGGIFMVGFETNNALSYPSIIDGIELDNGKYQHHWDTGVVTGYKYGDGTPKLIVSELDRSGSRGAALSVLLEPISGGSIQVITI